MRPGPIRTLALAACLAAIAGAAAAERLRNDITVEDHALTHPWTVTRYYQHIAKPEWHEYVCTENNNWVQIGGQSYYLAPDGNLMPTAKGQPAPDLRYFNQK